MSGLFETAAGAFAVVGVVDVLVRTGRELHTFLREVSDAPSSLAVLRDNIGDMLVLANTCKGCLQRLIDNAQYTCSADVVVLFRKAVDSLEQEVKRLNTLTARYKGKSRRWSSIKYVLDESRIAKAINNVERSKSSMSNTLALANSELSFVDMQHTMNHVTIKTDEVIRVMKTQSDSQDTRHQESLAASRAQQHSISLVVSMQTNIRSAQKQLLHTSKKNKGQLARLERDSARHARSILKKQEKSQEMLEEVRKIHVLQSNASQAVSKDAWEISYYGGRRDSMIADLSPLKNMVDLATNRILADATCDIEPQDLRRLRAALRHLQGSAIQEDARRYAMSTATSFDRWVFSENVSDLLKISGDSNIVSTQRSPTTHRKPESEFHLESCRWSKRNYQEWKFNTSAGVFCLRAPGKFRAANASKRVVHDVAISLTTERVCQSVTVDVRFFQALSLGGQPQICAQLNVFTEALGEAPYEPYEILSDGSIEEVDAAFRTGIISPYSVDRVGSNMVLYTVTLNARADMFDYLVAQGIGLENIRNEGTVIEGLQHCDNDLYNDLEPHIEACLERVARAVPDPIAFFATMALQGLFLAENRYNGMTYTCLRRFHALSSSVPQFIVPIDQVFSEPYLTGGDYRKLIYALADAGADLNLAGPDCACYISIALSLDWYFNRPELHGEYSNMIQEIVAALVEVGVDLHQRDMYNRTPSMNARRGCRWMEWKAALSQNNMSIDDVVSSEGNHWLLDNDWRDMWDDECIEPLTEEEFDLSF